MQIRLPIPKGSQAPRGCPGAASSKPPSAVSHRSGRKSAGSDQNRGSRCSAHIEIAHTEPAGTGHPSSVVSSSTVREKPQAGG